MKITKSILYLIAVPVLFLYIVLVGLTSRRICLGDADPCRMKRKRMRNIYAFWHNRIFYFCWLYRYGGINIPVSTHSDGLMIARVARLFGHRPILGSTDRNPVRVLAEMIRAVKEGRPLAVTPDGPKGPRYSMQDGLFLAALKTGAPVLGAAWYAKKVKLFKSWDRFVLPLPFNTFVVKFTKAYYVRTKQDMKKVKQALKYELDRITRETENYFT